jgi:hypothetical protein
MCWRFPKRFRPSPVLIFAVKEAHRVPKPGILRGMNITVTNGLPPRLGMNQHEGLLRQAAPCSFYHVHPANRDRIPCFISGYRVCLLDGQEGNGVLLLRPERDNLKLQLTEAASGVSSYRPCFVPIDSMHRGVTTESSGCAAPHLVRVKILGVVDEDGIVKTEGQRGDGFPQPGHEAFLFPQGVRHFTTENGVRDVPAVGVRLSGLCGGRITILEPLKKACGEARGIPILCDRTGAPTATAWV